jgi:hypothetical protein
VPRYLVKATVSFRTPGRWSTEPLWFGILTDAPVNVGYLEAHGYDVVPADGLTAEEARRIGVETFEEIRVTG